MSDTKVPHAASVILPPKIQIVIEIDTTQFTLNPQAIEMKISTNAPMAGFQMLGIFHSAMAWAMQQIATTAAKGVIQ